MTNLKSLVAATVIGATALCGCKTNDGIYSRSSSCGEISVIKNHHKKNHFSKRKRSYLYNSRPIYFTKGFINPWDESGTTKVKHYRVK